MQETLGEEGAEKEEGEGGGGGKGQHSTLQPEEWSRDRQGYVPFICHQRCTENLLTKMTKEPRKRSVSFRKYWCRLIFCEQ